MVHPHVNDRTTPRVTWMPAPSIVWLLIRVVLSVAVLSTVIVSVFFYREGTHHFIYLADNLVHGVFSVNNIPNYYADRVVSGGNVYLPFAPMPGILLMPFAGAFGLAFDELWLGHLFNAMNVLLAFVMLKRLRISASLHKYLLVLFFCGTIYFAALVIGRSWFLSHLLAMTFLLLAINEALASRRAALIGFWLGLGFLTRSPTIFSFPFFVWMLKPVQASWKRPAWLIPLSAKMLLGFALPLFFYLYYNDIRFGNPLETGYALAVIYQPIILDALKQGLFNPVHIPKNLYAFLLAMPQAYPSLNDSVLSFPYLFPSPWGMSIFLTTPALVYVFAASWRERIVPAAWLASVLVLVPLLLYYGIGWYQFGYRYALDFYPFLFVLTALGMAQHFNCAARVLIALSICINIWGAWWQMMGFNLLLESITR